MERFKQSKPLYTSSCLSSLPIVLNLLFAGQWPHFFPSRPYKWMNESTLKRPIITCFLCMWRVPAFIQKKNHYLLWIWTLSYFIIRINNIDDMMTLHKFICNLEKCSLIVLGKHVFILPVYLSLCRPCEIANQSILWQTSSSYTQDTYCSVSHSVCNASPFFWASWMASYSVLSISVIHSCLWHVYRDRLNLKNLFMVLSLFAAATASVLSPTCSICSNY